MTLLNAQHLIFFHHGLEEEKKGVTPTDSSEQKSARRHS